MSLQYLIGPCVTLVGLSTAIDEYADMPQPMLGYTQADCYAEVYGACAVNSVLGTGFNVADDRCMLGIPWENPGVYPYTCATAEVHGMPVELPCENVSVTYTQETLPYDYCVFEAIRQTCPFMCETYDCSNAPYNIDGPNIGCREPGDCAP